MNTLPGGPASAPAAAVQSDIGRMIADAMPHLVATLMRAGEGRLYLDALVLVERPLLEHVLRATGGNQLRAARLLGINRNTLRNRLRVLGLKAPRVGKSVPA